MHIAQRRYQAGKSGKDLYSVLGVSRGAKVEEIKKAYLQKAKKLHPDVNPSPKAAEEFAELKQAADVLSDPSKRSVYDMTGNASQSDQFGGGQGGFPGGFPGAGGFPGGFPGGAGGFPGGFPFPGAQPGPGPDGKAGGGFPDIEYLFERMGGMKGEKKTKPQGPEPGADVHFKLKLNFLEAVNGCSKEISYNTMRKCAGCAGTGAKDSQDKAKCPHCNGRGKKVMSTGFFHMQQDCSNCGGTGETGRSTCTQCTGKGVVKDRAVHSLPVPKGVDNRERLKVTGKGEAGVRGGPPGNLYVELSVEDHPVFHRDALNIHLIAPITLSQAILGGNIRVPSLTGELETKVPPATQQGDKLLIRGRGVHRPQQQKTGDLFVHFAVMLPKELSPAQKEAIAQFAKDEKPTVLNDAQLTELKRKYTSWFAAQPQATGADQQAQQQKSS